MIHLTDAAIERVNNFLKGKNALGIYVHVSKSGCHGYSYHIDLADQQMEAQCAYDYQSFKVFVDQKDIALIDGMRLDVKKEGLNEYFTFDNPQAESTCGCGTSFNI